MRVHRRHVETPRTNTAFSHRPATLTHTAQDESAYGAPSKCSLGRFEHASGVQSAVGDMNYVSLGHEFINK